MFALWSVWWLLPASVLAACAYKVATRPKKGPNPFTSTSYPPRVAVPDKARYKVLKQRFSADKVPAGLDAIVIGSGMGGLSTAVILAKAGKRVLVLEQHDQAGGCCHTFYDKGYEFDTGIHYIGEMRNRTTVRFLLEQITNGHVEWAHLDDTYDTVVLGDATGFEHARKFPIVAGREKFREALLEKFPDEGRAIDRYLTLLGEVRRSLAGSVAIKMMPEWLAGFLIKTGLIRLITSYFSFARRTVDEVLRELTNNEELRAVLAYSYGDYGTPPGEASFAMHAVLINHYLLGGSYPVGGPSEIPLRMIPLIESAGGKVFVKANVTTLIVEAGEVRGVVVNDGVEIRAPVVISTAGVFNTYGKLLPEPVRTAHNLDAKLAKIKRSVGCFSLFVGLNGTSKELGLTNSNIWAFKGTDHDQLFRDFAERGGETCDPPLLFISFPSAKDPTWEERCPGKAALLVISLACYEWFEQWKDEPCTRRDGDYEDYKQKFAKNIWASVLQMYPQLADRVEYINLGTPLSNEHYLAQGRGETYGVDHNIDRFSQAWLRPTTPVPGLFLAGQDIFSCGFAGAMFTGLLAASAILNRNCFNDLMALKAKSERATPAAE